MENKATEIANQMKNTDKHFELFDISINRPDYDLRFRDAKCPFCDSKSFSSNGIFSTAAFPSHKSERRMCNGCSSIYNVNEKGVNTWITDKEYVVLKGMPNCFEDYKYKCKCGGTISRQYKDVNGVACKSLATSFVDGVGYVKQYKTYFDCNSCGASIETSLDYWDGKYI